jgi:hypothetical protein
VISKTIKAIGATCTVVAALAVVAVPTASAKHGNGRGVRIAGTCDNTSSSKLKVKRDDGRLKFEFEVDQNVSGVVWDVEVTNDGKLVFQGERTTSDPSGSFSVERRVRHATSGTIVATATTKGETCTATLTIPAKQAPVVTTPTKPVTAPATVGHDTNDDNGNDPAAHDANEDNHGNSGSGNAGSQDDNGHHGNDD